MYKRQITGAVLSAIIDVDGDGDGDGDVDDDAMIDYTSSSLSIIQFNVALKWGLSKTATVGYDM